MTYIEFYDNTAIENICSTMVNPPQRMILIGPNGTRLKRHADRYREILAARGYRVEIITRSVSQNSVLAIVEALTNIVQSYDDCHIDLTGGGDLYLVAAGIVGERFKDKGISMHHFNLSSSSVVDCDLDGRTVMESEHPALSVEENIRVYGGSVISTTDTSAGMHEWICGGSFDHDIRAMWSICRKSPKAWNRQVSVLAALEAKKRRDGGDMSSATVKSINTFLGGNREASLDTSVLGELYRRGLVSYYDAAGGHLRIKYKNEQIRRCLTGPGLVLELMIYHCARIAAGADGTPVYNDVRSGVCIDWDGVRDASAVSSYDTENEIDVMMMHGAIPVFVSCKNGAFTVEELYKLETVAARFGRQYARKVIVATSLDSIGASAMHIRQRAADMGIRIVGRAASMSTAELVRTVGGFWNN